MSYLDSPQSAKQTLDVLQQNAIQWDFVNMVPINKISR